MKEIEKYVNNLLFCIGFDLKKIKQINKKIINIANDLNIVNNYGLKENIQIIVRVIK